MKRLVNKVVRSCSLCPIWRAMSCSQCELVDDDDSVNVALNRVHDVGVGDIAMENHH